MSGFLLFHGRRAIFRLSREVAALEVHLEHAYAGSENQPWFIEAGAQLKKARFFLEAKDVEGGWYCFHCAERLLVFGMTSEELRCKAVALVEEAEKLSHWRRSSIKDLIRDPASVTPVSLECALRIRDEYDANQYHKIWLTSDQLRLLCLVSGVAVILALGALLGLPKDQENWSARTLLAVAAFGVFGSAFSVSQTIIGMAGTSKIPEYVANQWVTFMRAIFGSVTGLAGYVLYTSQVVKLTIGDSQNPLAVYLAVAFWFGFGGEKLINKVVGSMSPSDSGK